MIRDVFVFVINLHNQKIFMVFRLPGFHAESRRQFKPQLFWYKFFNLFIHFNCWVNNLLLQIKT